MFELPLFFRTGTAEVTFDCHKVLPLLNPGCGLFFVAQAGAAAPGKNAWHKANDFLIQLPASQDCGENAPPGRFAPLPLFVESLE
jgi:hypothetical protein